MSYPGCTICGLPIQDIDRINQWVVRVEGKEVHAYCRTMQLGIIPVCPLFESLDPKPCSNECVQARSCPSENKCDCNCENVACQIGQSVRALRAEQKISWPGYTPKSPNLPKPGQPVRSMITVAGVYL